MNFKLFDVFANSIFEGNPTGVVYYKGSVDKIRMQKIAEVLSVPDTLFMLESSFPKLLFSSFAFSPYEELKICAQGIIGGVFSILEDMKLPPNPYEIETALGRFEVFIEGKSVVVVFTSLGRPKISQVNNEENSRIFQTLENNIFSSLPKYFVDLGRNRLVIEVPRKILDSIQLHSSDAMNLCNDLEITGIVFFSRSGKNPDSIRSRHFTTSLNGSEDAVTGGASGAILAFCLHAGIEYPGDSVVVHQGGFDTREGYVYVKFNKTNEEILVGGKAIKTAEGKLFV